MIENDFSLKQYSKLLNKTISLYDVVGSEIFEKEVAIPNKVCLLRHDIDRSPRQAEKIANIEAEQGVKAVYFVLINSDIYNPFETTQREALKNILGLGHSIGLHFDADWNKSDSSDSLEENLAWERQLLQDLLETEVNSFSFHNPSDFTNEFRAPKYSGMWNYYSDQIRENFVYISDSNGVWKERSLEQFLVEGHSRIHILTHPEWWGYEEIYPGEIVARQISERALNSWKNYCESLSESGRDNVTEIGSTVFNLPKNYDIKGYRLVHSWLAGNWKAAYLELFEIFQKDLFASIFFVLDQNNNANERMKYGLTTVLEFNEDNLQLLGSTIRSYLELSKQKKKLIVDYPIAFREDYIEGFVEMGDMANELYILLKKEMPLDSGSQFRTETDSLDSNRLKKLVIKNRKKLGISFFAAFNCFKSGEIYFRQEPNLVSSDKA